MVRREKKQAGQSPEDHLDLEFWYKREALQRREDWPEKQEEKTMRDPERTVFREAWSHQFWQMPLREEQCGCTSEKLYLNLTERFWWSVGIDGELRRSRSGGR